MLTRGVGIFVQQAPAASVFGCVATRRRAFAITSPRCMHDRLGDRGLVNVL